MVMQIAIQERKRAHDALAWIFNVTSSVLIVFSNKLLMDPKWGYKFVFATTLCALHFFASAIAVKSFEAMGFSQKASMPLAEKLYFSFVAATSIVSLNLSLLMNTVGFYQVSKLLIIPFICLVEYMSFKRGLKSFSLLLCILLVLGGVGIVTVTDVSVSGLSVLGISIAAVSVVTSGMQQILCGQIQRSRNLSSTQLLSNTAPVQGLMLIIIGPILDWLITGKWVTQYEASVPAMQCLAVSCAVAALVNISQFMCLGRFQAVTFQVLGHTKTVLVLLMGWLFMNDIITYKKLIGMTLAVTGMVSYGYLNSLSSAKD